MAGTVGPYQYVSDDGTTYQIRMSDAAATAQGSGAATTEPALPQGYHPRHVFIEYSTYRRKIPLTDPTDTQWTGSLGTISMKIFPTDAAPVTWNIRGRIGEKRYSLV